MFRILFCFALIGAAFACAPKCPETHFHDGHHHHCHCAPFKVEGSLASTFSESWCGKIDITCKDGLKIKFNGTKPSDKSTDSVTCAGSMWRNQANDIVGSAECTENKP